MSSSSTASSLYRSCICWLKRLKAHFHSFEEALLPFGKLVFDGGKIGLAQQAECCGPELRVRAAQHGANDRERQRQSTALRHDFIRSCWAVCPPACLPTVPATRAPVQDQERSARCSRAATNLPMEASRVVKRNRERGDSASSGSMSALLHTSSTTINAALFAIVVR